MYAAAACFAKLESRVGAFEMLLTLKSTLGTWPALEGPSTGRGREY